MACFIVYSSGPPGLQPRQTRAIDRPRPSVGRSRRLRPGFCLRALVPARWL